MSVLKCAREGCLKAATADDFCSAYCCRVHHGLQVRSKKPSRAEKRRRENGPEFLVLNNDHVNRLRHEGPQPKQRIQMTSGS